MAVTVAHVILLAITANTIAVTAWQLMPGFRRRRRRGPA